MSAEACRAALRAAPIYKRAEQLDAAFPKCFCEPWSLTEAGGPGIADHELVARILTSPDAYDEEASTVLSSRLTQIYSLGMSIIRQGASDAEIASTVQVLLTGGDEARKLIGAVVMTTCQLRSYANDEDKRRWFGVYATDDRGKQHHGDVLGTNATSGQQSKRRRRLASDMLPKLVRAETTDDLVTVLRTAGL